MKKVGEIIKETPLPIPPVVYDFTAESHTYTAGGQVFPSVTGILRDTGLIDTQWFDELSRDRGSFVHLATQFYDEGTLDAETLDERIKPYLRGYIQFRADSGFEPLPILDQVSDEEVLAEGRRFQNQYRYAGTIDRIGILKSGRKAVLDIKSGALHATTRLQLAAYQGLLDKPGDYTRIVVRLSNDGKYKVTEFPVSEYVRDFHLFASCLSVVTFKKENKL